VPLQSKDLDFQQRTSWFFVFSEKLRCDCSFYWYWLNCWSSLFKLSLHKEEEMYLKIEGRKTNAESEIASMKCQHGKSMKINMIQVICSWKTAKEYILFATVTNRHPFLFHDILPDFYQQMPLLEQELCAFPEHLSSSQVYKVFRT